MRKLCWYAPMLSPQRLELRFHVLPDGALPGTVHRVRNHKPSLTHELLIDREQLGALLDRGVLLGNRYEIGQVVAEQHQDPEGARHERTPRGFVCRLVVFRAAEKSIPADRNSQLPQDLQ